MNNYLSPYYSSLRCITEERLRDILAHMFWIMNRSFTSLCKRLILVKELLSVLYNKFRSSLQILTEDFDTFPPALWKFVFSQCLPLTTVVFCYQYLMDGSYPRPSTICMVDSHYFLYLKWLAILSQTTLWLTCRWWARWFWSGVYYSSFDLFWSFLLSGQSRNNSTGLAVKHSQSGLYKHSLGSCTERRKQRNQHSSDLTSVQVLV